MVNRGAGGRIRIWTPRLRHKAADQKMAALSFSAQANPVVALIVCKWCQEPRVGKLQAFDPPHIADQVFIIIPLYRQPFFVWQVCNSIYRNHPFFYRLGIGGHPLFEELPPIPFILFEKYLQMIFCFCQKILTVHLISSFTPKRLQRI